LYDVMRLGNGFIGYLWKCWKMLDNLGRLRYRWIWKPLPIQGTNVILDTPEAIDSWIAERRKRWPTAQRTEDKEQKHKEAVARGQIQDPLSRSQKKRKFDDNSFGNKGHDRSGGRGAIRGGDARGRGRGRGRGGIANAVGAPRIPIPLPPKPQTALVPLDLASASESDSDSDMDPEHDAISSKAPPLAHVAASIPRAIVECEASDTPQPSTSTPTTQVYSRPQHRPQPRPPPQNPFDKNRNTLLHNILLPEIRMTISNFSQALRFLVDNDFLDGVELKPGEADAQAIQVVEQGDNMI